MAVTTSTNKIAYTSTGGTVFAYDFKILDATHLTVYLDGVVSAPSTYAVTGVGNDSGGNVTFLSAVTPGVEVLLVRTVPVTQLTVIPGGTAPFPSEAVEDGLDKLTMIDQQLGEVSSRAITWPITVSPGVSNTLPDPDDVDNWGKAMVYGSGTGVEMHPINEDTNDVAVMTTIGDMIYHTGSTAARLWGGSPGGPLIFSQNTAIPKWVQPTTHLAASRFSPDGVTDDWSNLQALLNVLKLSGGGVLELQDTKTYNISQSLIVPANVTIEGNGALLQALPVGFTGSVAANTSALLRNENHGYLNIPHVVTSFEDSRIVVRNLRFDYKGNATGGNGCFCIWFRYVDKVLIENCYMNDCTNATALLACRDTYTINCHATECQNAGFDHWDGAGNATVVGCTVRSLVKINQGIQFTGEATDEADRNSINITVVNNKLYGIRNPVSNFASAIIANANDAGSTTYRMFSAFNYIEDADIGIVFSGAGGQHTTFKDTLVNVTGVPILMQTDDGNSPAHCSVLYPTLADCNASPSTAALIALVGIEPEVRHPRILNSGSPPYAYIVRAFAASTNAAIDISNVLAAANGTSGRILNEGTGTRIYGESVSYTPGVFFDGAANSLIYNSRSGSYTRYGDLIHARGTMDILDNGVSTGNASISLPFTASAGALNGLGHVWMTGAAGLTSAVMGTSIASAGNMALYDFGATGATQINETNIINGTIISFSIVYRAAVS